MLKDKKNMGSATIKQNLFESIYYLLSKQLASWQPSQWEHIRYDHVLSSMAIPCVWIETQVVWKPETQHTVCDRADFCFHHLSPWLQSFSKGSGTFAISSSKRVCIASDSSKCSYSKSLMLKEVNAFLLGIAI